MGGLGFELRQSEPEAHNLNNNAKFENIILGRQKSKTWNMKKLTIAYN